MAERGERLATDHRWDRPFALAYFHPGWPCRKPLVISASKGGTGDAKRFFMNNTVVSVCCPVCGADMMRVSTVRGSGSQTVKFRCTCGHAEDRHEDVEATGNRPGVSTLKSFEEIPSNWT